MSDLASMTFLSALTDNKMVIDITIIGDDGEYTVHLFLSGLDSIRGDGSSLAEAISDAHVKFEEIRNEFRN